MEKTLDVLMETSLSQAHQIQRLCITLDNVLQIVEALHARIQVLEGQNNQNTNSRN